jgi:hypothetical protein
MPPQSSEGDIYVPRDEAFSDSKQQAFTTKTILAGVHQLDEAIKLKFSGDKNASFPSLAAIDALFEDGFKNMPPPKEEGNKVHSALFNVLKVELGNLMKGDLDKIIDFETPEIFQRTQSIILLTTTVLRRPQSINEEIYYGGLCCDCRGQTCVVQGLGVCTGNPCRDEPNEHPASHGKFIYLIILMEVRFNWSLYIYTVRRHAYIIIALYMLINYHIYV